MRLTIDSGDRKAESEGGVRGALEGALEGRTETAQDRDHRACKAAKSNIFKFFTLHLLFQRKLMNRIPRLLNPLVRLVSRGVTVRGVLKSNPRRSSKSDRIPL